MEDKDLVEVALIEGCCDASFPTVFQGWIIDRSNPAERIELDVLRNGVPFYTITADQYRDDLRKMGMGDGRCGFSFAVPFEKMAGDELVVDLALRIRATGELLTGSGRRIDLTTIPLSFSELREMPDAILAARLERGAARARKVVQEQRGELPTGTKVVLYAVNSRRPMASHRKVLSELREAGYAIVVVNSDERFGRPWLNVVGDLADVVVLKRDEGRDFSSWLTAFHVFRAQLEAADHVLFVNESLAGPIRPLGPTLERATSSGVGFYALSDSFDVRYHLQSSFFLLSAEAIRSRPFREFVGSYSFPDEKRQVIEEGEIGLSTCLLTGGISYDVMCRYEDLCRLWMAKYDQYLGEVARLACFPVTDARFDEQQKTWISSGYIEHWIRWVQNIAGSLLAGESRNAQHVFWRVMIEEFDYPFVKRELLFANPGNVPDLSALFSLVSDSDRELLLSDMREFAGRSPPLQAMPLRKIA